MSVREHDIKKSALLKCRFFYILNVKQGCIQTRKRGIHMKKRINATIALLASASLLCACAADSATEGKPVEKEPIVSEKESESSAEEEEQGNENTAQETDEVSKMRAGDRPQMIGGTLTEDVTVMANVASYEIAEDLSNVENLEQFYFEDEMKAKLAENGFVVCGDAGREFYEIYEANRYGLIPNFVTVDSLMHTYHLYFAYLLKGLEKEQLSDKLRQLSERMLADSMEQYEQLKGSEWESAARRNVAFFAVGAGLLGARTAPADYAADMVKEELDKIQRADGIYYSAITGDEEDYTQYVPRGYYEGDSVLEQYFKAMMWYGRIHFKQEEEEMDRSALLMTAALTEDVRAYELWESLYAVTSFFAGASDDLGVCEYASAAREVYGEKLTPDKLAAGEESFARFHEITGTLPLPQINSIPIFMGEDNVIRGFRFMGQRFTIDASVMQKLIYSQVKEDSNGMKRMLPDTLDVPAALGSDTALQILQEAGETDYAGYMENMEALRTQLAGENTDLWSASLYACWLNTLRPLLQEKGEGYPVFMQGEEWAKKNLECFAGSFTELKHDTVLYSKQVVAEMGGGYDEEVDDRGYVEPEPLVYARFAALADQTAQGLKRYGMLKDADEENLSRLSQMAGQFRTISEKELQDEVLTDEEYECIRIYGGNLEHFWYETVKDTADEGGTVPAPAALVVDIATDPNGDVLEIATGNPSRICVVVKVDGKVKIASGSVYSFYQFPWPMEDRLTDNKWHQMLGVEPDEGGEYHYDLEMEQPAWTESYRYHYEWD